MTALKRVHHLSARAVAREVAEARGYRSAERRGDLGALGFRGVYRKRKVQALHANPNRCLPNN